MEVEVVSTWILMNQMNTAIHCHLPLPLFQWGLVMATTVTIIVQEIQMATQTKKTGSRYETHWTMKMTTTRITMVVVVKVG